MIRKYFVLCTNYAATYVPHYAPATRTESDWRPPSGPSQLSLLDPGTPVAIRGPNWVLWRWGCSWSPTLADLPCFTTATFDHLCSSENRASSYHDVPTSSRCVKLR